MRFSPGCGCCSCVGCPVGWETGFPTTLFVTLDMECGGYEGAVITVTYDACLSARTGVSNARVYNGGLPTPCGNSANYTGLGCDAPELNQIQVFIQCDPGLFCVRVAVTFGCTDAEDSCGFTNAGSSNAPSVSYGPVVSWELFDPVDFAVPLGATGLGDAGLCCVGVAAPGFVRVTE